VLLHAYAEVLAGGDASWWHAATRRTARLLEREHTWIDTSRAIPRQALLIDTTALLTYALARSRNEHPAAVTGMALAAWTCPRLAPLQQAIEHLCLAPGGDRSALWSWHGSLGRMWKAVVQETSYLLVAAGHLLPVPDDPAPDEHPVVCLWAELVERDDPTRRYASMPGPALIHGLAEVATYFARPALQP
jgi:hypothetical protein